MLTLNFTAFKIKTFDAFLQGWWGGDSLIKLGMDCAANAKSGPGIISPKNLMPGQKLPKNLMTGQVPMNFSVQNGIFQKVSHVFFTLLSNFTICFGQNLPKP